MNCHKLNEVVYSNIENALENPKPTIPPPEQLYYKSIYGPATLMNDWYEKRFGDLTNITSTLPLSENMDQFRKPCKSSFPDRQDYFNKIFDSYGLGQELLTDHLGFSYYDNYTTTNDLMFNHLKKGICGPLPRHYIKGSYKPETDLTNVFGNLTQWGLKETVYNKLKSLECITEPKDTSETNQEFVHHDLHTVRKLNDFKSFKRVKVSY